MCATLSRAWLSLSPYVRERDNCDAHARALLEDVMDLNPTDTAFNYAAIVPISPLAHSCPRQRAGSGRPRTHAPRVFDFLGMSPATHSEAAEGEYNLTADKQAPRRLVRPLTLVPDWYRVTGRIPSRSRPTGGGSRTSGFFKPKSRRGCAGSSSPASKKTSPSSASTPRPALTAGE